ncbi:TPM domain-containing protein [uncultured Thiothrix sp.]|uniref:TPM domain-containing protein n=1 Tax=uncultured Thiothrix sp. TaxID=223185 RepID=UPI00262CE60D|nr:TPM domain-containing protein [uncultured Thiothrix sp.]HMT93202.1 TPM domain-containing protein [Thiolinea sp.]
MVRQTQNPIAANPSFKRWWKHAIYMPWLTARYFNKTNLDEIEQAVQAAELGHAGEIVVIIEGSLPFNQAYYINTQERALELFGQYKVWDTEYNSGMLLYVNICEHRVELVADRGIHQFVMPEHWQTLCDQITTEFTQSRYALGVLTGVKLIGQTLQAFYTVKLQEMENERSNRPLLI